MKTYDLLVDLLALIEENINKNLSINKLASNLYITPFHLQRIFKYIFNVPIASYIRSRRLALSIESLLNTNLRIIDIALEYGFEYEQTYIRAFKREYGISPGEYRKSGRIMKITPPIILCDKNKLDNGLIYGPEFVFVPSFYVIGRLYKIKFGDALTPNIVGRNFEKEMDYIPGVINPNVYIGLTRINDLCKSENCSQYLTSVQVESLDNVPNDYTGDCFHASLCARFRYIGEHHYRDITWHKAKQMYEAINYFTDNINKSYASFRHELFFERIDISVSDETYCQMEWFTPIEKI